MVNNICIGIISYLPDLEPDRSVRILRLLSLISDCDTKLQLPIIIIAQNWKDFLLKPLENCVIKIYKYDNKLGITQARIALRYLFIVSDYNYVIMLDDDMELNTKEACLLYLQLLDSDHDYFYIKNFLMNYSCISRSGFYKVNFDPEVNAEEGTGFEDVYFCKKCKQKLRSKELTAAINIKNRLQYVNDKYSTWEKYISKEIINSNYNAKFN